MRSEDLMRNRWGAALEGRRPARGVRSTGQTLAEFAIVLPFLLLLLIAIIDFGFYLYDYISTQAGLRDGARAAMQARNDDNATAVYTNDQVKQIISTGHGPISPIKWAAGATTISDTNEITIFTQPADTNFDGDFGSVTIYVEHTHQLLFPFFLWAGDGLKIKAKVTVARIPGLAP